jgi:apolipoprotein N-acyltransferase
MSQPAGSALSGNAGQTGALDPLHRAILKLRPIGATALACVAGILSNLAYAPYHVWGFQMLGLVIFVWLLDGCSTPKRPLRAAFSRGFWVGFGFFTFGLYWVGNAFLVDAETFGAFIWMGVLALPALLALFWGMAGLVAHLLWRKDGGRILVFAIALGASEMLRGWLFGGFPWNWTGTIWPPGGAISQVASLVGVQGLTLLTVLALATPAALVSPGQPSPLSHRAMPMFLAVSAAAALWSWGAFRLDTPTAYTQTQVRVVDTGASQADKWADGSVQRLWRSFVALSRPDAEGGPDVVIWPEGAFPFAFIESPEAMEAAAWIAQDRTLILGSARTEPTEIENKFIYFNSLVVLDENAVRGPRAVYDKYRLVPFGEVVPFASFFSSIGFDSLSMVSSGFKAGERPFPVSAGRAPRFGPLICYEVLFPGLTPRGEDRPDWLVNISIDAWYGTGAGPAQHFAQARYRAIEEGLPLARSASGGVSAIIDGYGRITSASQIYSVDGETVWAAKIAQGYLPTALKPTVFARFGWLAPLAVFVILCAVLLIMSRKK